MTQMYIYQQSLTNQPDFKPVIFNKKTQRIKGYYAVTFKSQYINK